MQKTDDRSRGDEHTKLKELVILEQKLAKNVVLTKVHPSFLDASIQISST